jgi:hypothetical protein
MKSAKLILLFVFLASAATADDSASRTLGEQAVQSWLQLVDSGDYSASWREAASPFKNQIAEANWVSAVIAAREPFGSLVSRKMQESNYETTLPGVPDGQYVVMKFEAVYEKKASATEVVTSMLDGDEWRVAGYYIR